MSIQPKHMNEKIINDYMSTIFEGTANLSGLEADVADKLRMSKKEIDVLQKKIASARNSIQAMEAELQQSAGRMEAYASVLIAAEDARRAPAKGEAA